MIFLEPTYRTFILASKSEIAINLPVKEKDKPALDEVFFEISENFSQSVFDHMTRALNTRDKTIFATEKKYAELLSKQKTKSLGDEIELVTR